MLTALGAIASVVGLVYVGGRLIGEGTWAPPLTPRDKPVPAGIRWNPKVKRWQDERGKFVKAPA